MYQVITVWQALAMNLLISCSMVKAMVCLHRFLLLDWNTHFPSCEECCLLSLLRKLGWWVALPNAMPLSLAEWMHPTTGCSRRWALGFHQGQLQRLSWHHTQHKMGSHLCYDCCSVQILQATWSGSSSPHRVFVDWTPDKTPISVSETASWGKQPKTSCNHSRNWSSGHYLTWVTQLRRSSLNPHILLFPKQDRQLLLLLLRGGWWQMYSSQYRVIQNFSWRVLIWHDHWFQKNIPNISKY